VATSGTASRARHDGERDHERAGAVAVEPGERRSARALRQRDVLDPRGGAGRRVESRPRRALARAVPRDEDGAERGALRAVEVALHRVLDALGLRPRHPESAAGEVVGLAGGQRKGGEEDEHPGGDDEPPATVVERVGA
jgi:hypothetical protein